MKLLAFSIYDTKTGCYGTPFFMRHAGEATRAIADLAQDTNTTVGRHPADYALMSIGEFDDQAGLFSPHQPISLGMAVSFIPANPMPAPLFDERPARVTRDGGDPVAVNRGEGLINPNGKFIAVTGEA